MILGHQSARTRNQHPAPANIESLEERCLFAAFGTMNVIDAGTGPEAVVTTVTDGVTDTAPAGVLKWTRSAANPGTYAGKPVAGQGFDAFCIEPDQGFANLPNVSYKVVDLESAPEEGSPRGALGAAKADQIRELWGRFRSAIGSDGDKAAAFQVALWEIVVDTDHDVSGGAFFVDDSTPAIKAQAQAWLDGLTGTGPKANLLALTNASDQDQVFEIPPTTTLVRGMTATIGFWQNKNGQKLLKSLNGGPGATDLGNWLADNFPNLWGANAGPNNLAGKTNTQVAAFFVSKFSVKGVKLDAQILGSAFATYVTNSQLAGNVATKYGFIVNTTGTGAAGVSVGKSGAAFGVANYTVLSVWELLKATDASSAGGSGATRYDPYNGSKTLRNMANTVYTYINEKGDIL